MTPPALPLAIRALTPADADAFRALRLMALAASPEAFGLSVAEEEALAPEIFRERLDGSGGSAVFGAFADSHLIGIAGFLPASRLKARHKGTLWGVFVAPEWRGHGLARRLVEEVIAHARGLVLLLQANVVTTNETARKMYHRLGFVPYGLEERALCVDGVFYDEELLVLDLELPRLS